ncbi:TIGR04282 family arsenosugar biosynthesis glycosyltransferase [Qipengyuania sp. DSG2-2]|uniref:TIGR04282 family arsenosugar biosynthesis glycosyltransferase n=1 Tax=Qipengyuania sp. DGS2-2 TaxID=3349631 RepID=UPI0036D25363
MSNLPTVSIFARWPEAGKAKTRLIPAFGPEGAVAVYRKLLVHTLEIVRASGLPFELRATGAGEAEFQEWLGSDVPVAQQGDGDLTAKLQRAPAPGMAIGSDCPGLTPELLQDAAEALTKAPVTIGPASDGGYWLIGYSEPSPWLFEGIAWSTDAVLPATLAACQAHDVAPAMLPELSDVDEPRDLDDWPEFLP